ncbi:MAG TPA: hypothetical protein VFG02_05100, partial [Nitrospirota bacterium]|nr:hypothetical protein [Nitrospirota bacterium]
MAQGAYIPAADSFLYRNPLPAGIAGLHNSTYHNVIIWARQGEMCKHFLAGLSLSDNIDLP